MTRLLIPSILLASACCASAALYSTSFDGLNPGDLSFQDNWLAQTQWDADGAGNAVTVAGGFIRMQNSTVAWDNSIASTATITANFSLIGAFTTTTGDPDLTNIVNIDANWKEGIFVLALTDDLLNAAPSPVFSVGLHFEPDQTTPANSTLELRGPGGSVSLGTAASFNGHAWSITVGFTHDSTGNYSYSASLDSLNDAAIPFTLNGSGSDAGLGAATAIHGVAQTLPVAGVAAQNANVYDGVTVSDYSFDAVPEPSSLAILGLLPAALLIRRRA